MTSIPNIPGLKSAPPIQHVSSEHFSYDHVPVLRELLPQYRGIPGYYYLQVEVNNLARAENEGWLEVANCVTYSIKGPNGSCNARLYCYGARIPGADYRSSKRECFVDRAILEATGLRNESAMDIAETAEPEAPVAEDVSPLEAVYAALAEDVLLMKSLCGLRDDLKGENGKAAHERRCKHCAEKRAELGIEE